MTVEYSYKGCEFLNHHVTERIQEFMEQRGWTEYRLVKETGLPASTIANIFHRGTTPSIPTLEIICDALGISLSQFFSESDFVSLNSEQADLLRRWSTLSAEQKKVLLDLMSKMN